MHHLVNIRSICADSHEKLSGASS